MECIYNVVRRRSCAFNATIIVLSDIRTAANAGWRECLVAQRASRQRSLPDVVPAARLRFWIILAIAGAAEDEDPRHVSWTAPNQRDDRQPRPAARSWHRLMAHRHGSYCVGGSFSASGHRNTFPLAFSL